ncbi:FAD-binding oxidoreductase [Saxibacter everestensis]|uniref:FAD-binding oxidoreductase n=1 Tax=Saxibacter everestensis TaxID=2909229 RepID=A0ABY8QQD1_9MICO|nr:FAD-binding oxidoreductase [Brevibacteriaceae bacterium ZFBP1038]
MSGPAERVRRRIAVVGAGVVGTALAYYLARDGAQVLLIDERHACGGVTKDSFGWVGLSASASDPDQAALRHLASTDLDRIEDELPLPVSLRRNGALSWSAERGNPGSVPTFHQEPTSSVRIVSRPEIQKLEPSLINPPQSAVFAENDGSVDPVALTLSLLRGAQHFGATLSPETRVREVHISNGRVSGLRTVTGTIDVDTVVLAAGTETTGLARTAGVRVPINPSPCILMRFTTPKRLLNRIVSGPEFEFRQATDSMLLAAEDYVDDSPENGPEALARLTLETIHNEIAGSRDVALSTVSVGRRPIPEDGRPVIGSAAVGGLYVVSAHAAVALACGIGRLAAEEIIQDRELEALKPFRPARFAG